MLKRVGCVPEVSKKHIAFSIQVESTAGLFLSNFLCPFTDVTWVANIFRIIKCKLLRKFCQTVAGTRISLLLRSSLWNSSKTSQLRTLLCIRRQYQGKTRI